MPEPSSRRGFLKSLLGEAAERARDVHESLGPLSPLNRLDALAPPAGLEPAGEQLLDPAPPPAPAPYEIRIPTRCAGLDELLALAEERGLAGRAEDIRRLARHGVHLVPCSPARPAEPGASRLGGAPDLPAGVDWPVAADGERLTFLAQVALADVALPEPGGPLPADGALLFFGDVATEPSGLEPVEARVVLVDAQPAAGGESAAGCAVDLAPALELAPVWSDAVRALDLDEADQDAWEAVCEELALAQDAEPPDSATDDALLLHLLLGHPRETAGSMPLACELLDAGHEIAHGYPEIHPYARELAPRAARWRPLLQLSVDEHLGLPAGTEGRLVYWIDEQALRRGDLTQVRALRQ